MDQERPIIAAIFDIETLNDPTKVGGWPSDVGGFNDRIGLAVGVVRWTMYRPDPTGKTRLFARVPLFEGVYFSAAGLLDALLHPMADVAVGFNAHRFDLPVLVGEAVPDLAGPYLTDPSPADVVAVARKMATAYLGGFPLVLVRRLPEYKPPSGLLGHLRTWWQGRGLEATRWTMAQAQSIGPWMARARRFEAVNPPGAAGLRWTRAALLERMKARTFDPLAQLQGDTGHPHLVKLDWLRESAKVPPFLVDGQALDHATLPDLWNDGDHVTVVRACQHDVEVLDHVIHLGINTSRVGVHRLSESYHDATGAKVPVDLSKLRPPTGSAFPFEIPTAWWRPLNSKRTPQRGL